jgi:hypothetical protein
MKQKNVNLLFLTLAFAFEVPISGSIGNGRLQKGKTATATIVMDIPGGLHVNSNRPLSRYAIPTRIRVTGAGLKLGAVSYPRGKVQKFSFSEEQIAVYDGRTTFRVPVTVPANFSGNVARIRVVVSYQSCTDEVCYRPRTGEVTLSAAVR